MKPLLSYTPVPAAKDYAGYDVGGGLHEGVLEVDGLPPGLVDDLEQL